MSESKAENARLRVLVTGSRDWADRLAVYRALNALCDEFGLNDPPDEYGNTMPDPNRITVVHGACPTGADHWADQWCLGNFFTAEAHPADWSRGKKAGPERNAHMVSLGADVCLAFPHPGSRGTANCMRLAREAGIPVRVYSPGGVDG